MLSSTAIDHLQTRLRSGARFPKSVNSGNKTCLKYPNSGKKHLLFNLQNARCTLLCTNLRPCFPVDKIGYNAYKPHYIRTECTKTIQGAPPLERIDSLPMAVLLNIRAKIPHFAPILAQHSRKLPYPLQENVLAGKTFLERDKSGPCDFPLLCNERRGRP